MKRLKTLVSLFFCLTVCFCIAKSYATDIGTPEHGKTLSILTPAHAVTAEVVQHDAPMAMLTAKAEQVVNYQVLTPQSFIYTPLFCSRITDKNSLCAGTVTYKNKLPNKEDRTHCNNMLQ